VKPNLSIVIVSYNTRQLLRECLDSVYASPAPVSEVVVVDNASSDGSAAMVRKHFPQVRLIANEDNRGFAAANNQALRALGYGI
jgi:GT2 family glycosyltransferase